VELVFVAETARDLSKVTWLTHDCFFDLDQMKWDEEGGRFELPFGRGSERRGFLGMTSTSRPDRYDCVLAVSNVRALSVRDEARIGCYDLLSVTYDETENAVIVESCIPLKTASQSAQSTYGC